MVKLENIRKIWLLVGTLIATLGLPWIPEIVNQLFSVEGTEIIFQAFGAIIAAYQFITKRVGDPEVVSAKSVNMWAYGLNPFKAAA